jgi:preprotein translocase subunit SecG
MIVLPVAKVSFIMSLVSVVWLITALALILIILVQKSKGGGLGAAFGGGAGSRLGTNTGDFLTWVTIGLVTVFLLLAILMVKFYKPTSSEDLGQPMTMPAAAQQDSVPAATPDPAQE